MLVGTIGGALIIYGWYRVIKKRIDKSKGKNYTEASADEGTHNSNPPGVSLQPINILNDIPYPLQPSPRQRPSPAPSSSTAAKTEKTPLPPSSPYNPLPHYPSSNSDQPPPYGLQFPATAPAAATPFPYPSSPSSYPGASPYLGAPSYTGASSNPGAPTYPGAPSYPGASSQVPTAPPTLADAAPPYPGAPYPGTSAGPALDVINDPPPAYTPTQEKVDIYQPII
ncbi:unnamed protein product [Meganyctiphanes norvegica]|uniref:Uncharacterized protein n=1 Tax=Meganyctiphanes norvegica TaxID=48144 RepID=A0AAV2PJ52_MEGNR